MKHNLSTGNRISDTSRYKISPLKLFDKRFNRLGLYKQTKRHERLVFGVLFALLMTPRGATNEIQEEA